MKDKLYLLLAILFYTGAYCQSIGVIANQGGGSISTPSVPIDPPTSSGDTIILGELKAFPTAFGEGAYLQGGRGGTVYELTDFNSWKSFVNDLTGPRIGVWTVAGTITMSGNVGTESAGGQDLTIIGQTSPGGVQIVSSGSARNYFDDLGGFDNSIMRHMTFAIGQGGNPSITDVFYSEGLDVGTYIDHCSFRYGWDEIVSLRNGRASNLDRLRVTFANNILAEAVPQHNTGGIFGSQSVNGQEENSGRWTYARNMTYNISHRFPNVACLECFVENYNNLIVNWSSRLMRVNGSPIIEYYNNYADYGNNTSKDTYAVNKWEYDTDHIGQDDVDIYTTGNFIEGFEENISLNPQYDLWTHRNASDGFNEGDPLGTQYFNTTRSGTALHPPGGVWTATETASNITATVGHTRMANSQGMSQFRRDSQDASYINKYQTGTTESSYRAYTSWTNPTIATVALWADSDNDFIADEWETMMGLNNASSADATTKPDFFDLHGRTFDNKERTGGSYDVNMQYVGGTLTGNNLYTWQEIYWSYLANDFQELANEIPTNQ